MKYPKKSEQEQFEFDMRNAALQMAFKEGGKMADIEKNAKSFLEFMRKFMGL